MGTNKRDKKLYIRMDGNGKAISASAVWRNKMPKVGKWVEVTEAYSCCNFTTTTTTTTTPT